MALDIVIVFVAAFIGGYIADRLRQPVILGYIIGGILVGPFGLGLVHDLELVTLLADTGVILLMFTLGIEFSFSQLAEVKRVAVSGGILQVTLMILITLVLAQLIGYSTAEALIFGCAVAISSTMIVMRSLGESGELNTRHGQTMLGILIVQDLAVILFVSMIPLLNQNQLDTRDILFALAKTALFIVAIVFLAKKLVPLLLDRAARSSSSELFMILALSIGLGIAALAYLAGLSVSLGAFIAGLIISESEYAHEVMGKIITFRDGFVVLFFVSVGMLVNPGSIFTNLNSLLIALVLIIPIKAIVVFSVVRLLGYHSRIAFLSGLGLAQTGEFSFVLANIALGHKIISGSLYDTILASTVITILVTPFLIKYAPRIYRAAAQESFLRFLFPEPFLKEDAEAFDVLQNHIILCGYGRVGLHIGKALQAIGQPFVVIDYDYNAISGLSSEGVPNVYGDAANEIVVAQANPQQASMAVLALPDSFSNRQALRNLQKLQPGIPVLARAHNVEESNVLYEDGALDVVQPETEAGLQLVWHIMYHLDVPHDDVDEYLKNSFISRFNNSSENGCFRRIQRPGLRVQEFLIPADSVWAGKTLRDSNIREKTGCNVVVLNKPDGSARMNPHSDEFVQAGDHVLCIGTPEQLKIFKSWNEGDIRE